MDLKRAYLELRFRERCRDVGESFQDFFSTLMELRYPKGDFIRVRPWGDVGDRKNDGYLSSKRYLFQCFGPRSMSPLKKCLAKVKEDFAGALPYWKKYFDTWVFVHNGIDGIAPDLAELLLQLSAKHKPLNALPWGFTDLHSEFAQLSERDMETLVGPVPGIKEVLDVRVESVKALLETIAVQPAPYVSDVRAVPPAKLQHNQLSDAVASLLKAGMTRVDVVDKYLRGGAVPTRYDQLAATFRSQYEVARDAGLLPDEIFLDLQKFVVGHQRARPIQEAAALAILAFFFEACEIFERPPSTEGPLA